MNETRNGTTTRLTDRYDGTGNDDTTRMTRRPDETGNR